MRAFLVEELKKEVVGPGIKANPGDNIPYTDPITGEEILLKGVHISNSPVDRYGAGILFPQEITQDDIDKVRDNSSTDIGETVDLMEIDHAEKEEVAENNRVAENDCDDDAVSMANQLKPSAMGLTIRCHKFGSLKVDISSARYERASGTKPKLQYNNQGVLTESDYQCEYFIRKPLNINPFTIHLEEVNQKGVFKKEIIYNHGDENWLQLIITNRSSVDDIKEGFLILTFTIVNVRKGNLSQNALFQNEIKITASGHNIILPYQEKVFTGDKELEELNLLYRKKKMYGIGHGCAASWLESKSNNNDEVDSDFICEIKTSVLPEYEIPLIEAQNSDSLAMYNLSDLESADWEAGKKALENLRDNYFNWINELERKVERWDLIDHLRKYKPAAKRNLEKCRKNYYRIKKGVALLTANDADKDLVNCFKWMNHAMLWQQQRSKLDQRKWIKEYGTGNIVLPEYEILSLADFHNKGSGRWRPFQLAFVLMNIESVWNEKSEDRKILDLIWFPTGGGKTEAYLGLSAFQIFVRRIKAVTEGRHNHEKYSGTAILMKEPPP
jgi:hypothetical protein